MHYLPETGFVRLSQVLNVIPIGKTNWWAGVKSGRFPQPIKLTERCTAWRVEDIRNLITQLSGLAADDQAAKSFSEANTLQ
jgi:predicted DNA-binding transcriptional regulator AlpA